MMRNFLAIAGIMTCTVQGCATSGPATSAAPIVDFSQRIKAYPESPETRAAAPAPTPTPAETALPDRHAAPAIESSTPTPQDVPAARTHAPIATHPAALALLNEAMRQEKSGELEIAAAKLERALRIEPRNPLLWHQLAALRLRQGQTQLAANLAQKSNSYVAANTDLAARNQRIIDRARER